MGYRTSDKSEKGESVDPETVASSVSPEGASAAEGCCPWVVCGYQF